MAFQKFGKLISTYLLVECQAKYISTLQKRELEEVTKFMFKMYTQNRDHVRVDLLIQSKPSHKSKDIIVMARNNPTQSQCYLDDDVPTESSKGHVQGKQDLQIPHSCATLIGSLIYLALSRMQSTDSRNLPGVLNQSIGPW